MSEKRTFSEWLRSNAERYLLEAAADKMAAEYPELCTKPYREWGLSQFFWRCIFVPLYSLIPWSWRRFMILLSSYGMKPPKWGK